LFAFFNQFKAKLAKPFTAPTIDEIRAGELQKTHMELMNANHTVMTHMFVAHLAKAKIQALHSWEEVEKSLGEKNAH